MPTYSVNFYNSDYTRYWPNSAGNTFVYSGPTQWDGSAVITETDANTEGQTLVDDNSSETATGDITVGGTTYSGAELDAEQQYTIRDTVTGQTFQVVQFQYESGRTTYTGTLSETQLINGRTYEVVARDTWTDLDDGDVAFAYSDFRDGIIDGTAGNDTIDAAYTGDPNGDRVDTGDGVNDTATNTTFRWADLPDQDLTGGASATINGAQITIGYTDLGVGQEFSVYDGANDYFSGDVYVENGEPFDPQSSAFLFGDGTGNTALVEMDFASTSAGVDDEVRNVQFRINDVDRSSFVDQLVIEAYDANGNPVEVVIYTDGDDVVSGNTITSGSSSDAPDSDDGSVLVQIGGPVQSIDITYSNLGSGTQGVWISDVNYDVMTPTYADSINAGAGDDLIVAGLGDDTVSGGDGDDLIDMGAGNNSGEGGAGDDTFLGGAGNDTMDGGAGLDYVDYSASGAGVSVDLSTNSFSGGDAAGDSATSMDGLLGSDFDDTLIGSDAENLTPGPDFHTNDIHGGDGNDYIDGMGGNDSLYGDAGNDTILGGAGDDSIDGGVGDDQIQGGDGADILDGGDGDDTLFVGSGDTVAGGDGDDLFIIDPTLLTGGTITIDGLEGDEDDGGDVIDFNGTLAAPITWTAQGDDPGGRAGTATLVDGTVINFSNIEKVICFARGTRILTPRGPVAVENLRVDHMVLTRDNGLQPIRWINARRVPATGDFAPLLIAKGAMGNDTDLVVSPQHRMLIKGPKPELLFGQREVLAAAKHLVDGRTIHRLDGGLVDYFHIMFDQHELIFAEGAITESFHAGEASLSGISDPAREELFALFPELRSAPMARSKTARLCLRKHEAHLLRAA